MAEPFSFRLAEKLRKAFAVNRVRYLFIGKSGAIILGYPDTTQDADIFVKKDKKNCSNLVRALKKMGFRITKIHEKEILAGKVFIQLRNGPFDLDLVFAPDGIESFDNAWKHHVVKQRYPVCHLDDIIKSKEKARRTKDLESLPRLRSFRDYWSRKVKHQRQ